MVRIGRFANFVNNVSYKHGSISLYPGPKYKQIVCEISVLYPVPLFGTWNRIHRRIFNVESVNWSINHVTIEVMRGREHPRGYFWKRTELGRVCAKLNVSFNVVRLLKDYKGADNGVVCFDWFLTIIFCILSKTCCKTCCTFDRIYQ